MTISINNNAILKLFLLIIFGIFSMSLSHADFVNWETPHVHPMDLTPNGTKLLSVNTPNNTLEVFTVTPTGISLERSIPVGLDPVSVRARSNTQAWVVNHVSDSISVIDLNSGSVIATLNTDDEPADIVFAGSPLRAFVSCSQSNTVMVFNPDNLSRSPQTISINGEDPRALAVSRDGLSVYAAIFESGNGSTIIAGGRGSNDPGNVVDNPNGPYGGVNPPPNSGASFNPPVNPTSGTPPRVGLIVRKDNNNRWLDDNNRDWSQFVSGSNAPLSGRVVGWDLPDRDIAIIKTSTLEVSYQHRVMTTLMAMDINPTNGQISIVGTEANNQIRYEPNVRGIFIKVNMAQISLGGTPIINDINPHLNYNSHTVPTNIRNQSIGDPRGIKWNSNGTLAYITGMGSNNVAVMNPAGARVATINVGEGPTGIILHEASNRAFVLNKFDSSISIINLQNNTETGKVSIFDPTPSPIKVGRKHLYDTHKTSGLGQISCASCHIDARHDRLAWDLGNPAAGTTTENNRTFHPMKGPMRTQTLLDIVGSPNLHFRGDRADVPAFADAFVDLQGADNPPSVTEMNELETYLATVHVPPNPYRNLDNSRPTSISIPGPGNRVGNPFNESSGNSCGGSSCHSLGNLARGADIIPQTGNMAGSQPAVAPPLRNQHELFGLYYNDQTASNAGFAFIHDGSFDSNTQGTLQNNNNLAFMLAFNGDLLKDSHAAVGKQVTISGNPSSAQNNRLSALLNMGDARSIGIVAKGNYAGETRGFFYEGQGTRRFQSDRFRETVSLDNLLASARAGNPITFTAVPIGSEKRIGVDENEDGIFNNDTESSFVIASWSFEQEDLSGSIGEVVDNNNTFNGTAFGGVNTSISAPAIAGNTGTCNYIDFDGTDDYINLGNPSRLNIEGEITLSAWIRPDQNANGIQNIMAHTHSVNPNRSVFLRTWNGNYQIGSWDGTNHLASARIPAGDVGTGAWVHLAGVYNGSAWILYRNGVEIARQVNPVGALRVDQNWTIGAFGTGTTQFFNGAIDEVYIEGRSLSSDAIRVLMNATHDCNDDVTEPPPPATISNPVVNISVDGSSNDWNGLTLFSNDPDDVAAGSTNVIDFESAGISHNDEKAFVLIRNRNAVDPNQNTGSFIPWGWQIYIDSDNNAATGFAFSDVVGADYLIEGSVIQKYNGSSTEWNWLVVSSAVTQFNNNILEMSFNRNLIGNPQSMRVVFQGANQAFGGNTIDIYPDGAGDSQSNTRYFNYSFGVISPHVNIAPVAFNQGVSVISNSSTNFTVNATDEDDDLLSVEITNASSNGNIQVNDLDILYTPNQNFVGADSFSYRVNDGLDVSNIATVTISVIEGNTGNIISNAITNTSINIDGNRTEWNSLRLFNIDPDDITTDANNHIDWKQSGLAHSLDTVYLMYENYGDINPTNTSGNFLDWGWQTYLDTDNNPNTGYQYNGEVGADILVEGDRVFRFGGGEGWDWVALGATTLRYNNTIAELSFPRNWLGSHDTVNVAFFGNNQPFGGISADSYPDSGSFEYFFGAGSFGEGSFIVANSQAGIARSVVSHEPRFNQTTITPPISDSTSSGGGNISWLFLLYCGLVIFIKNILRKYQRNLMGNENIQYL